MKIGILTFHRAYNYGAFLQCYSLQNEIKKRFPEWDLEIIDYSSKNMGRYYQTSVWNYLFGPKNTINNYKIIDRMHHLVSRLIGIVSGNSGISAYRSNSKLKVYFEREYNLLPLSDEHMVSDDYDKVIEFIKKLDYDIIVVGSDAIWNDYQTNIPNAFYLSPVITCRKMSYAASCYGMSYEQLQSDRTYIRDALRDFDYLGVRDDETDNYLKSLDRNLKTNHNCDPTILLNLEDLNSDKNAIRLKLERYGIDFNRPVIGVMGNSRIGKIAREVCGETAQLVGVYYANDYCNASVLDLSPSEWANIFSFFSVTFTSFFHGTIFSLKNGTPTITIEQNKGYAKTHKTKTKDLLQRLGLDEYYIEPENQQIDYIKNIYYSLLSSEQRERIKNGIQAEARYAESFFDELRSISSEVCHESTEAK